ncbi:hypothetical protein, partial [Nocardia cyriacigeorgica]|uniref:hypothetical protein n=1 Tax=Nocardia cyriacigeorgica TaxID=135487 RepID=UPI0024570C5D
HRLRAAEPASARSVTTRWHPGSRDRRRETSARSTRTHVEVVVIYITVSDLCDSAHKVMV